MRGFSVMKDKQIEDIKKILEHYPPLIPMQDGKKTTMDYRLNAIKKYINDNYTPKTVKSGESSSQMSDDNDPSSKDGESEPSIMNKQNTEQLKKIEEVKKGNDAVVKVLTKYGAYTTTGNFYALVEELAGCITKTTPSHDEIKREAVRGFASRLCYDEFDMDLMTEAENTRPQHARYFDPSKLFEKWLDEKKETYLQSLNGGSNGK